MLASLLGIRLTLYLGPTLAVPAPAPIAEALSAVEVTQSDEKRDAFQLTFTIGRGAKDIIDYPLLSHPLLRPFTRVVLQVWLGVVPEVLIDGFITRHQVNPSDEPGASTLTVTGEDVRVMMDMQSISMNYPQMTQDARVRLILAKYMMFLGAPPIVIPPIVPDVAVVLERIPAQSSTDLDYIEYLAREVGYVFYVEPTPTPMVNIAYWGPDNRLSIPQSALSINMGPDTNVTSMSFSYNALEPTTVLGMMQEKRAGLLLPVIAFTDLRPPLALLRATIVQLPYVRVSQAQEMGSMEPPQAFALAQALVNRSGDAVRVDGELDAVRYGNALRARRLVGVRGAGFLLDGFYYVKEVTHKIKRGEYKQSFTLVREGFGSLTPVVPS
jgi:hypothetical protein